ncbi:hypothetical protein B0H14DRAFT_3676000 [Mycena olivaceomarginata]|nr:hypothetical protein B0H14DRAFT_3676000 [Mycena olivaceomarginata]
MKLIQITALLAPFIVMVLATVPRGCITSLVCDGGARQTAKCLLKGYGCPDKNPTPDPKTVDGVDSSMHLRKIPESRGGGKLLGSYLMDTIEYSSPIPAPALGACLGDAEPVDGLVDGAALLVLGGAVDDVLDGGADERLIGGGTMVTLPDGADEGLIGGGTMVTLPEGAGVELPGGDTEALTRGRREMHGLQPIFVAVASAQPSAQSGIAASCAAKKDTKRQSAVERVDEIVIVAVVDGTRCFVSGRGRAGKKSLWRRGSGEGVCVPPHERLLNVANLALKCLEKHALTKQSKPARNFPSQTCYGGKVE